MKDRQRNRLGLFDGADQQDFAGRDAQRALDLFMAGVADENHGAAFGDVTFDFRMNLGHEGAGRIDYAKTARGCAIPFGGGDAMGAEDDPLAFGYVIEILDEDAPSFSSASSTKRLCTIWWRT